MQMNRKAAAFLTLALVATAAIALGQGRPDPHALITAQKEAMASFSFMDGTWRGKASMMLPNGEMHDLIQTERIGSALDGSVKVIEGRGYEADGSVWFEALAVISFDPNTKAYSMRSYAQGMAGDFTVVPSDSGFSWEIPAGPMTINYVATIKNGTWHETGTRTMPGKDPVKFFDMTLTRVGDTDWPSGGALGPK